MANSSGGDDFTIQFLTAYHIVTYLKYFIIQNVKV